MFSSTMLLWLVSAAPLALGLPFNDATMSQNLESRQLGGGTGLTDCTFSVVKGSKPKPAYFHAQVTEVHSCGSASECTVSKIEERTFGYSVAGGLAIPWVSGGFGVTQEWTSGQQFACTNEKAESVCVWLKVAHTAYMVKPDTPENCPYNVPTPVEMKSPNKNNAGGEYYCVTGKACRSLGEGYWEE
ncbi:MAG: hypothetical protein M1825_004655 [Sarcosagium campestre]|nr:MAG: hypothetical protein M1825_004655 [Sarcosagium campestre]